MRERGEEKHGARELYVQNPQGIAVNSFLFEENLQLGNRPFYDLFAVVIGCGWSCAGAARLHGLFPDFPGEFAPAFCFPRASPPLFLTFVSAEVGSSRRLRDRGSAAAWAPAVTSSQLTPGRYLGRLRAGREPGRSPRRRAPGYRSHSYGEPNACFTKATPAVCFPPGPSSSNMSPNLPRRVRAAGQHPMDSSRRPGRPPAARHPPGKSRPPGARAARDTALGNGCHLPGALHYPRTWGLFPVSPSLTYVPWDSRWGLVGLRSA